MEGCNLPLEDEVFDFEEEEAVAEPPNEAELPPAFELQDKIISKSFIRISLHWLDHKALIKLTSA